MIDLHVARSTLQPLLLLANLFAVLPNFRCIAAEKWFHSKLVSCRMLYMGLLFMYLSLVSCHYSCERRMVFYFISKWLNCLVKSVIKVRASELCFGAGKFFCLFFFSSSITVQRLPWIHWGNCEYLTTSIPGNNLLQAVQINTWPSHIVSWNYSPVLVISTWVVLLIYHLMLLSGPHDLKGCGYTNGLSWAK